MRAKLSLDFCLVVLLLLAFAYQLTGNLFHEIIGTVFVVFVLVHNLISRRWYASIRKGKMPPRRILTTALNLLLLVTSLLMVVSGVLNSHDIFPYLHVKTTVLDRHVHAMAAYWVLILVSLHLGLHWQMVTGTICRMFSIPPLGRNSRFALHFFAVLLFSFGVYAFFERDIPYKIAGLFSFDYWDFGRDTFGYFLRYIAIISVGVCAAHMCLKWLRR